MKFQFFLAMTALLGAAACSGDALPAVAAEAVPASEYSFLTEETPDGDRADVLIAAVNGVEHRLEKFGYMLGTVIIQEDLNGDGTIDAIAAVHSGGNCCPADYYFVADLKDGQYAVTQIPEVYAWEDPVTDEVDGAPAVRFVSVNEGMNTSDYLETTHIFRFEGETPVIVSETVREEVPALAELRSSAFDDDPIGTRSFSFDLNGDGRADEITCGLWERWGRLTDCAIVLEEGAAPIAIDANCKRLGVAGPSSHGMHDLLCDADQRLAFDPASGQYTSE